ncbi:hypothetical protein D2E71_26735 [Mycobacteroides abscessus]|nr:hypothetical protein D2E71_26735 [Mycobacteroides abscessus]
MVGGAEVVVEGADEGCFAVDGVLLWCQGAGGVVGAGVDGVGSVGAVGGVAGDVLAPLVDGLAGFFVFLGVVV